MLTIVISGERKWDDEKEEFIPATKDYTLQMEHSLLSISKWEAIYHKAFLITEKNFEMIKVYAKCMTINNVPDEVYERLSAQNIDTISEYIKNEATATYLPNNGGNRAYPNGRTADGDVITAELIYYWMVQMNIPVEFQKWHINRLLILIRLISLKNDPKGGKGQKMTAAQRKAINRANRARFHTKG